MTNITLGVDGEQMQFSYLGRKIIKSGAECAYVNIPDVMTTIQMGGECNESLVEEGIAFSPVYHLALRKTVSEGGIKTWLRLRKAN